MASTEQLESALQEELEKAKSTLKGVDESLQRFLGRDPNEPRPIRRRLLGPGARPADEHGGRPYPEGRGEFGGRGFAEGRAGYGGRPYHADGRGEPAGRPFPEGRAEFGDRQVADGRGDFSGRGAHDVRSRRRDRFGGDPLHRDDDMAPAAKRRITHGSNGGLGVMVIGPRLRRASASDEEPEPKPSVASHVIPGPRGAGDLEPPDDGRSRQTALQERKSDKENINRSRRMFGALLGTLQRFRRDEVKQKDKVEKRAEIERRLEDAARREKAELRQQRSDMFATRKRKQQEVRLIEMKMARVKQEEGWEAHQKHLMNFIRTSGKPCIYFLPKLPHPNSDALLLQSQKELTKTIEERRQRLQEDLAAFDARLHRLQNPTTAHDTAEQSDHEHDDEDDEEDEDGAGGAVTSSVVIAGDGKSADGRSQRGRRRSSSPGDRAHRPRPEQGADTAAEEREEGEVVDENEQRARTGSAGSGTLRPDRGEQEEPMAVDAAPAEEVSGHVGVKAAGPETSPSAAAAADSAPSATGAGADDDAEQTSRATAAAAEEDVEEEGPALPPPPPPPAAADADVSPASPDSPAGGRQPSARAENVRDAGGEDKTTSSPGIKQEPGSPDAGKKKREERKSAEKDTGGKERKDGEEESVRRKDSKAGKEGDRRSSRDDGDDRRRGREAAEKGGRRREREDSSREDRRRDRRDSAEEGGRRRAGDAAEGGRRREGAAKEAARGERTSSKSERSRRRSGDRDRRRRRSGERDDRRGGAGGRRADARPDPARSSRPSRRRSRSASSSSSSSGSSSSGSSSANSRSGSSDSRNSG